MTSSLYKLKISLHNFLRFKPTKEHYDTPERSCFSRMIEHDRNAQYKYVSPIFASTLWSYVKLSHGKSHDQIKIDVVDYWRNLTEYKEITNGIFGVDLIVYSREEQLQDLKLLVAIDLHEFMNIGPTGFTDAAFEALGGWEATFNNPGHSVNLYNLLRTGDNYAAIELFKSMLIPPTKEGRSSWIEQQLKRLKK